VAKGPPRQVRVPVVTMDFLAPVMDVLAVARPTKQQSWHFGGLSPANARRTGGAGPRVGWMYASPAGLANGGDGYAYRYGGWKLIAGGVSCDPSAVSFNCTEPQLYDMSTDFAEVHDLAS
jgi:hypothetical protein